MVICLLESLLFLFFLTSFIDYSKIAFAFPSRPAYIIFIQYSYHIPLRKKSGQHPAPLTGSPIHQSIKEDCIFWQCNWVFKMLPYIFNVIVIYLSSYQKNVPYLLFSKKYRQTLTMRSPCE